MVIVEVGAFGREGDATTVRQESQALLRELNSAGKGEGAQTARLVRVNALYPLIAGGGGGGDEEEACISVMGDELDALARIDAALGAIAGGGVS